MLQLNNRTPFDSQIVMTSNPKGADVIVLAVKATFTILPTLALAQEQEPLCLEDLYLDEPDNSSLVYASDVLLPKPGCDVILNGCAYAPKGQIVGTIDTYLSVGEVAKTIKVFGDRLWVHGGQSDPKPFSKIPLIYENAYGGLHHYQPEMPIGPDSALACLANPLGKGFIGKRNNAEMIGQALPNLEDPRFLIRTPHDQPIPACYGGVLPTWEPRQQYAGTYDDNWQKTRAPFLPLDFDERFLFVGSNGLSLERRTFTGGEPIRLINLHEEQTDIQFELPICDLDTAFKLHGNWVDQSPSIETIMIEPDLNRLCITWKTAFVCNKKQLKVSDIRVDFKQAPQIEGI